jgi:hypothetical protein
MPFGWVNVFYVGHIDEVMIFFVILSEHHHHQSRIEALGGETGVQSRSDGNQGSQFWFTFPYRPFYEMNAGPNEIDVGLTVSPESRHILLVDDSLYILKVTSRLLTMNGHTVETAINGSIGLERLKRPHYFDMVITDLQMPGK